MNLTFINKISKCKIQDSKPLIYFILFPGVTLALGTVPDIWKDFNKYFCI